MLYDEVHLDRFVESIQSARFVFSGRLHPLLCSLPSAEAVAYTEQMKRGIKSGKFESMFRDVFSKKVVPDKWFKVNRSCVLKYKHMIELNIRVLRQVFSTWQDRDVCNDDVSTSSSRVVYLK